MRTVLTGNSETPLTTKRPAENTIIYLSGTRGTAVLDLCYRDSTGTLIPYTGGAAVSIPEQYTLSHGEEVTPELRITNADGNTSIDVFSVALVSVVSS